MKPKKYLMQFTNRSVFLATTLVFSHAAPNAIAATGTWANSTTGAGNWSDATKWVGGVIPGAAGDTANFNLDYGTNNKVITIDTTSRTVGILNIGDPGVTYRTVTIQASGGAALILNNGGSGAQLNRSASANNVIDEITAPITLDDALAVTIGGTATGANGENLRILGGIGETGGARVLTKSGTGTLRLGDASSYSGGTILNSGDIQVGGLTTFHGAVTSLGTGPLTINGGSITARNGGKLINNAVTVNADFILNGVNAGTNVMNLGGSVDLGGATRTITIGTTTGSGVISGPISNGGIIKAGSRPLTLGGANTYAGPTTVNAGILELTGSITGTDVTVASGATFTETSTGVIGGGGSFTNSGTTTLAGTNTYTGATVINGGTLTFTGTSPIDNSSGVSINGSGAKLVAAGFGTVVPPVTLTNGTVDGNGTINSMTVEDSIGNTISAGAGASTYLEFGTLTFNGAASLNMRANSAYPDQFLVTTDLATNPSADVVVNATNTAGAWIAGTDYPVIEFSNYLSTPDASHFTLGAVTGLNPSQTAELVNTGAAIVLRINSESLLWTGFQNSDWTSSAVGGAQNWTLNGNGVEFTSGSSVRFDDTSSATSVNLAANITAGVVEVFNTGTNDYSFSSTGGFGIVAGSLIKNGDAKLTIGTNNTFTGSTLITGGVLEVSGAGAISSSSSIENNAYLTLNPTGSAVYTNPITGTGSVLKEGSGTLTLSGDNTFSGDFTLDDGILNFNSASALGTGSGTITINGGSVDNTSGEDIIAAAGKAQTWNSDIVFIGTHSLDMGTGTVTLGGVEPQRTVTVSNGIFTVGEMKGFSQGIAKDGAGTLVLTSTGAQGAASVLAGPLTVSAGTLQFNRSGSDAAGSGDLTTTDLSGNGTITNGAAVERWLLVNTTGSSAFGGLLANGGIGGLGLYKLGTGTLTLTGANTYTGATTLGAGILNVQNGGSLGGSTVSIRTLAGGLQIQGGISIPNNFLTSNDGTGASGYAIANVSGDNTISGTITMLDGAGNTVILSDTGSLTLAGSITNGHTASRTLFLQGSSTGNNTVSGVISNGASNITLLTKRETGTWILSGVNTYTGSTSVIEGTLDITGSLGNTPVSVSGGTLSLRNTSAISQNVITFTGTGSLTQTVDNAISGTASVVVQKPLILSAPNNYSGDTTINAGTSMPVTITHPNAAGTGRLNAATGATTPVFNLHLDGGGLINMPNSFGGNSGVATTIDVNNNGSGANGTIHLNGIGLYGNGTLNVTGSNGYNLSIAGLTNNGGTAGTTTLNPTSASLVLGAYSSSTNSNKILQLDGTSSGNSVSGTIENGTAGTVAVTKSNSSTWTLAGTNTYSGATTINAGTLIISGNSSAASGAVTVANGATLGGSGNLGGSVNVQTGGHQHIEVAGTPGAQSTRIIGGTLNLAATADVLDLTASTSPADGTYVLLTANGGITGTLDDTIINFSGVTGSVTIAGNSLVLTVGSAGYAAWAATNAPGQTIGQDYDGDGVSNGVEFVLGGSATTNDLTKLPVASTSGSNLVFTFRRDQNSKTADVALKIEVGTTLASWPSNYTVGNDTGSSSPGVTVTDNSDGTDTITLTVSQSPDAKKFARLAVTVN